MMLPENGVYGWPDAGLVFIKKGSTFKLVSKLNPNQINQYYQFVSAAKLVNITVNS